jgi:hypothetical protein
MVGKVALFKTALDRDNLAKQLSSLYEKWRIQRGEKEAEWRELRNYLFATDTKTTSNSTLPWKNSTTLPKLTQIRDNLHANYMDALFPNDDWLRWEGFSADAVVKKKRKAIESYMKNKLRESDFRETVSKLLYDYIDYGNVFAEATWVEEKHVDPVTQEEVVTYVGPKAVRLSPFDIVFNPIAPSFKDSPKFTRYLKNIGELEADMQDNPSLMFDGTVLQKIKDIRKSISSFKMEDVNKSEGLSVDGFGSLFEYYQSGLVEIIEFEGSVYDDVTGVLQRNKVITIADRSYILRKIDNPSWFGEDQKVHTCWRERSDNIYGMGPLDNLVGLQYRLDHLENLKADALDQTILPPKVIVGDVEPFEWGPGVDIHVSEDGDVRTLPPNPAAFQVNNEIAGILQIMEEMAGAPKEAMGIRSPGEKTAFEVQQLQNAAGRIFQNKVNKFEIEFLEKLLNKMLELAKRNMNLPDVIRVMDDDIGVSDFLEVTKEDITAKGKLRPMGARHYAARAQLMQNLAGIFNSPVGQIIGPHISAKALAKMVEEYMGLEKYQFIKDNAAVFEGAETQRLVNQAGQTVETEQQVPVEEALM